MTRTALLTRVRALAFFVVLLSLVPPAAAQLNVGVGGYSLTYAPGDGGPLYTFDSDVYSTGFYSPAGMFHAFYGTDVQPTALAGDSTEASVIGFDLATGSAVPVAHLGSGAVEVGLLIPVGIELGYSRLSVEPTAPPGTLIDVDAEAETLHLGMAALRVGGGLEARIPLDGLPLASAITGGASLAFGAGAQGDFDPATVRDKIGQFDDEADGLDVYGLRTTTLTLQAQLDGILGGDLGVMVGYTFRSARTGTDTLGSAKDYLDVITGGGDYAPFERLHLVRVGVLF